MNDDEELGQSFAFGDEDDDDKHAEEGSDAVKGKDGSSQKRKHAAVIKTVQQKKRKRRSIKEEKNPREWSTEEWTEWLGDVLPSETTVLHTLRPGNHNLSEVVRRNVRGKGLNVVVVCSSASRCADVARELRSTGSVTKLFGKHMNVDDQARRLSRSSKQIAVGTAQRLEALHNIVGGLPFVQNAEPLILIDAHPDAKSYTPVSLPDAKHSLAHLLVSCSRAHPRLRVGAL